MDKRDKPWAAERDVRRLIALIFDRSLLRFLMVGVANTALGFGVIILVRFALGLPDILANILGYACGLMLSYVLNRRFTFGHHGSVARSAIKFTFAFVAAYCTNLGVLIAALDWLKLPSLLAQAASMVVYTGVFYLLCRFVAFTKTSRLA